MSEQMMHINFLDGAHPGRVDFMLRLPLRTTIFGMFCYVRTTLKMNHLNDDGDKRRTEEALRELCTK